MNFVTTDRAEHFVVFILNPSNCQKGNRLHRGTFLETNCFWQKRTDPCTMAARSDWTCSLSTMHEWEVSQRDKGSCGVFTFLKVETILGNTYSLSCSELDEKIDGTLLFVQKKKKKSVKLQPGTGELSKHKDRKSAPGT